METINFYNYDGHPNTVNKQLGGATAVRGSLRESFDIVRPTVLIRSSQRPLFNYCHIPSLMRYYFVDKVSFDGDGTFEVDLREDVLKTYEADIMEALATVTETENADPHISSRETVYNMLPNFEKVAFEKAGLLNDTGTIIMVTLKGK